MKTFATTTTTKRIMLTLVILVIFLALIVVALFDNTPKIQALGNGAANLPPMGWNSWNVAAHNVSEALIEQTADAMVSSGLAAAGYQYVNIDGGWYLEDSNGAIRDGNGNLQVDTAKFPDGMTAVGNYVHSKGLKLGIYLWQDSIGHEQQDANLIASFGVDYLKYDCWATSSTDGTWTTMRDALSNTGRTILYSIHHKVELSGMANVASIANMERVTNDVWDYYQRAGSGMDPGAFPTIEEVDYSINANYLLHSGFMPDMDMLWVGYTGETTDEQKTQFGMWSILSSPLIMGNDIRSMDSTTKSILSNSEIIAVDQDSALNYTTQVSNVNNTMVYVKPLGTSGMVKAVAFMNRNSSATNITVNWSAIGLSGKATVRDLWNKVDVGTFSTSYTVSVPAHGTAMLKISSGVGAGTYDDEDYRAFAYNGSGWSHAGCSPNCYAGTNSWDNTTNDNTTVTFSGTQIKFYGVKDPGHGIGAVSIDGGAETNVDFYAATRAGNQLLWTSPTLSSGTHIFKLRVTGTKNASSTNTWVVPDAVIITISGSPTAQPPTSTPPAFGGNNINILNLNSGQCLAVPGSSTTPGTQLVQWTCTGGTEQQWALH